MKFKTVCYLLVQLMQCRKMFKAEIPFSNVMTCEDDDKVGRPRPVPPAASWGRFVPARGFSRPGAPRSPREITLRSRSCLNLPWPPLPCGLPSG